jgi:hypothetical protein
MSNAHDRRAPNGARMPFEAMVEIGGAIGPSFEAQAVNLSEEGMHLRTAYLPEIGQPLMCRFDAGEGGILTLEGEVLWTEDLGGGGEFGVRFTNLDAANAASVRRLLGIDVNSDMPIMEAGRKVRLHIDGLASPMRARVRELSDAGVTAYSDLGFLQMGRPLQIEDATSGGRRPAQIEGVHVEVHAESRIPQLVVSLRYAEIPATDGSLAAMEVPSDAASDDEPMSSEASPEMAMPHSEALMSPMENHAPKMNSSVATKPATVGEDGRKMTLDEEGLALKGVLSRSAAKVTPAILGWANRAKMAAALLAARARGQSSTGEDVEIPMRRTTAPAPGGGLTSNGRKVIRTAMPSERAEPEPAKKKLAFLTPKKTAVIGTIGIASVLVLFAVRKPAAPPAELAAASQDTTTAQVVAANTMENAAAPGTPSPGSPAAIAPTPATGPVVPPSTLPAAPPVDPLAVAAMPNGGPGVHAGKVIPFTNGTVGSHPNIIKVKMDGPIEGIQGASQPTGFTVVTPNRKAAETNGALASKDPRIEIMKVANEAGGAEFNVKFKEGVPNYVVRAHGDTLEFVLAKSSGTSKAEANVKKKTPSKKKR